MEHTYMEHTTTRTQKKLKSCNRVDAVLSDNTQRFSLSAVDLTYMDSSYSKWKTRQFQKLALKIEIGIRTTLRSPQCRP